MKIRFKYDYNNKMLYTFIILILLYLILLVICFEKIVVSIIFGISIIILFLTLVFIIYPQGFYCNFKKNKLIVVDDTFYHVFHLNELRKITYKQVHKEKKSNIKGFFIEFYHPYTYMSDSKYVYNNGKVYMITIYLKNGMSFNTYFGWMYKEKKHMKVEVIEKRLKNKIDTINDFVSKKN